MRHTLVYRTACLKQLIVQECCDCFALNQWLSTLPNEAMLPNLWNRQRLKTYDRCGKWRTQHLLHQVQSKDESFPEAQRWLAYLKHCSGQAANHTAQLIGFQAMACVAKPALCNFSRRTCYAVCIQTCGLFFPQSSHTHSIFPHQIQPKKNSWLFS